MSSVVIEHTLGDVWVERDGDKKKVAVKFGPESKPFRLRDGDAVVTGKDGYVVAIAEQKEGKYRSSLSLAPSSKVTLAISTTISNIKVEKGIVSAVTNAPLDIPFVNVNYIFEEYPDAGGDTIFSMIKVEAESIVFANRGFPVEIVHVYSGKTERLMSNEQVTATSEEFVLSSEIDKDIRTVFAKFMELNQSKIDALTQEMQLGFYRSLEEAQEGIVEGMEEGLSYISLEGLESFIAGWEKGLEEDLKDMSPTLKKKAEPLVKDALKHWKELTEGLIERKKGISGRKKEKEDAEKIIKEIQKNLSPILIAQHEKRLRQYLKLTKSDQEDEKENSTEEEKESTEMEKKLDELNKEVEEGLEKLSEEIDNGS